jgi:glutaredoxin
MPAPLEVTLFGRPGCHLCEAAAELLHEIGRSIPLHVDEVNIETDDALLARYVYEIPVVVAGGQELGRAPLQRKALERALRDALAAQRR